MWEHSLLAKRPSRASHTPLTGAYRRPAAAAEFQAHSQAAVLVGGHGVGGDADAAAEPLPRPAIAHDHQSWQGHAVVAQLHRAPAPSHRPQLPTVTVTTQARYCRGMTEQHLARHDPSPMGQAQQQQDQLDSPRQRQHQARRQRQQMPSRAHHQQAPGRLPVAFEPLTLAGHGPGSCEPCAAIRDLRTRCAP